MFCPSNFVRNVVQSIVHSFLTRAQVSVGSNECISYWWAHLLDAPMTGSSVSHRLWIDSCFRAKRHKSSTVVFSGWSSNFARSHSGIFLINWRRTWIERETWAERVTSARRELSSSNRVRSTAASAAWASNGATKNWMQELDPDRFSWLLCVMWPKTS